MKYILVFAVLAASLPLRLFGQAVQFAPPALPVYSGGSSPFTATFASAPTQGNSLVAVITLSSGNTVTSISGGGVVWFRVEHSAITLSQEIWLGPNSSGSGAVITITYAGGSNAWARVMEFPGVLSIDQPGSGIAGISATPTTPNVVTANASDLLVAVGICPGGFSGGPTGLFTAMPTTDSTRLVAAYRVASAVGTYSTSWTFANNVWEAGVAAFKLAPTAPPPPPTPLLSVTTSSLNSGSVGVVSSQLMAAAGGVQPYSWSSSSSMPAGMSLSPGGMFQGTPTTAGTSSLNMQVADAAGGTANKVLNMIVSGTVGSFPVSQNPGPNMVPATDSAGVLNIPAGISTGSPKTCATVGPAVFPAIKVISDGVPGAVNCGCPLGGGTTGALAFAKLNGQWSCPILP